MASANPPARELIETLSPSDMDREPISREHLDALIKKTVEAFHRLDLHMIALTPPDIESVSAAFLWARCIPIVMAERARRPGYDGEQEAVDDVIWSLRDRGERYLAETMPASVTDAVLMLDLLNSEPEPGDTLLDMCRQLQRFLFDCPPGKIARQSTKASMAN